MSILKKERTVKEYKKKLEILPESTRKSKLQAVKEFQKFTQKFHNCTPEILSDELLILKKQNEDEYIDACYDILQSWINDYSKNHNANTLRTIFTNLRSFLYFLGVKTADQDIRQQLTFPKIQKEEKYPLSHNELRKICDDQVRNPIRKALYLACSSSGMRISEALQIKKSDLIFKERIQITLKPEITKTQTGRTIFLSKECQNTLSGYINDLSDDDFVFSSGKSPSRQRVVQECNRLSGIVERLGLGEKYSSSRFHKITSHSFRAFFFTNASRKHGENYAHKLTGHGGYLIQYDRMTNEDKLKMYIDLEPDLVIYDITKKQLEIEKLKQEQNSQLKEMKDEIQSLKDHLSKEDDRKIEKLIREGRIKLTHSKSLS